MTTNKMWTHAFSDFQFVTIELICNSSPNSNKTVNKRVLTRQTFWSAHVYNLQPILKEKVTVHIRWPTRDMLQIKKLLQLR